jgi:LPXTG-motif cell wall-anchored protein
MTKVQTGPTEIFLAILAVLLAAGFVYFKRRRQA